MRERHYRKRTQTTKNKRQTTDKNKNSACTSNIPENLFDILPFRETDTTPEEERKPYVIMTYLPDGIYHQMRRACEKAGVQLITKPGTKLKDLLCAPNKTHHDPSLKPVVYKINCPCTDKATYVGQTIRPVATRGSEHRKAAERGNWQHSGIAQHKETCDATVDWAPTVIKNYTNKNKNKLTYDLKIREALEIRRHNCGPGNGLNEDFGAYVRTTQWNPVFHQMDSNL